VNIKNTKPHEVLKDPEKDAADRRAKRKSFGEAFTFITSMGLAVWWIKSPETLKNTFHYLTSLIQ